MDKMTTDNTPLLPQEELHEYVERHFRSGKAYLNRIKGNELPLYLLDTGILKEKARQFKKAFFDVLPNVDFYYAVKSNNHPDVAGTLLRYGFGLDVSSGLELEMALDLNARKIVFSGPGKTREELLLAVSNSERVTVLMDSFGELSRLQEIASQEGHSIRSGIRLSTDRKWNKFGIAPEELRSFCELAGKCPNVDLRGIQFHTSWNLTPDAQCGFIERLAGILSVLPEDVRAQFEFLDVGGGYWPPEGEWLQPAGTVEGKLSAATGGPVQPPGAHYRIESMPIDMFAGKLAQQIQKDIFPLLDCRICFEPGRWICNDAMHLFLTVIDRKAGDLVITDAGTNAIGWERFETDYFPVLNLSNPSMVERDCNILGSLCTPHDIWGYSYWGEDIKEGDILMIPCQGAYTYSLRQEFIKPVPGVITV